MGESGTHGISCECIECFINEKNVSIETSISEYKKVIRNYVWMKMEKHHCNKSYPKTCHERIPNFKGSEFAAKRVTYLKEFQRSSIIKINQSLAQQHLRYLMLKFGKKMLVPSPALASYFMKEINPCLLKSETLLKKATTKAGSEKLGMELNIDSKLTIDIVIVASVACARNGVRLGKGKGYAEIEWAIFFEMGAVSQNTLVLTTVHENQIVPDNVLPNEVLENHDLPVDIIVTPYRIINVNNRLTKPTCGLIWDKLSEELISDMPILLKLKDVKRNT